MSLENINIIQTLAENFNTQEKYDLILLDAPCSGNLIKNWKWLEKRNLNGILQKAETQKKLLKKASQLLKRDGLLIYSTCSLEPEENEFNIDWIQKNSNLKTTQPYIQLPFDTSPITQYDGKKLRTKGCIRLMPYKSHTQGFFICCLENVNKN